MKKELKIIFYNRLYIPFLNLISKPNKDALWIFGFQKSGTTAIASLLAHMAGCTLSIDPKVLWSPYSKLIKNGELSIEKHAERFSYVFSKDIIKEPSTTFYIDKIESFFSLKKYVFIIRNPYSNIRSILNRLGLPGDCESIDIGEVHPSWRNKFENNGEDYIQDLAQLWLKVNSQDYYQFNERCVLVKYEDFMKDKENFIHELCVKSGRPAKNSIQGIKNRQFQPKGVDMDLLEFFGQDNIQKIDAVCGKRMEELGYNKNEIF